MASSAVFANFAIFISGLLLTPPLLFAGGFMIPHQTARGLSLSGAATAGVNDASAVYYNPAALSEVSGNNILATGSYIGLYNSVENSGRTAVNKHDDSLLASLFASYHVPGTDLTFGIGSYTPFGLATTYDRGFTRFAARRAELKTIFVTPALSWQPTPYLSIGAGASFVHGSVTFSRSLCFNSLACTFQPGIAESSLRLTDTDDAFGYNVGVLVKPASGWKFGFSYRGQTDLQFENANVKLGGVFAGTPQVTAKVQPVPLPAVINAGLFWQINDSWGAEFVYEHARWSAFKTLKAKFLNGPLPGFNLPQNWKNTSTLRFGAHYALNKSLELRGGFALEETPIPGETLNPAIPDADKLALNAGLGYQWEQ
jgi:long-chain fatty acid transport protein